MEDDGRPKIKNYLAKLLVFGSSVLKASANDGDMDLTCVCPKFIEMWKHFFGEGQEKVPSLYMLLKKCDEVKELKAVIGAKIPILKMKIKDLSVDINFANIPQEEIPSDIDTDISE